MQIRNVLYADDGMILTNGEVYGRVVYLAEGESADGYTEITEEEYNRIEAEKEAAVQAEGETV